MTYTVQISSRGTITIPKAIRKELGSSKILIIKDKNDYIFKPIQDLMSLAGSLKSSKKITDKDIQKARKNAFLRTENIK